jgi:hypothetical protein
MKKRLVKIADLDLSFQDPECTYRPDNPEDDDQALIKKIAAAMLRGEKIEPIIVYRDGGVDSADRTHCRSGRVRNVHESLC